MYSIILLMGNDTKAPRGAQDPVLSLKLIK